MSLEKFSLTTLSEMDSGRIRVAFEQALMRLELDCKDRPGVKDGRQLSLQLTLVPVADNGDLDSVNVTVKITEKLPKRQSKPYNMQAVPGGLLFNDASPEDVRQKTLDMAPKPTGQRDTGSRTEKKGMEVADVG